MTIKSKLKFPNLLKKGFYPRKQIADLKGVRNGRQDTNDVGGRGFDS